MKKGRDNIKIKVNVQSPIPASLSHSVQAVIRIRVVHQQLGDFHMQMRSSAESLQVCVDLVKTVVAKYFFKLTVEKSEVVVYPAPGNQCVRWREPFLQRVTWGVSRRSGVPRTSPLLVRTSARSTEAYRGSGGILPPKI